MAAGDETIKMETGWVIASKYALMLASVSPGRKKEVVFVKYVFCLLFTTLKTVNASSTVDKSDQRGFDILLYGFMEIE